MTLRPQSQLDNLTFRRVMGMTLVLVGVGLGFFLLYRFYQVIFILLVTIMLGTVIRPVVNWIYRKGLPKAAGVILVYFILSALAVGFILLLFPLVFEQGSEIINSLPDYYQSLKSQLASSPNQLITNLNVFLPEVIPWFDKVQQTDPEMFSSAGNALGYVTSASKVVFIGIAILLLTYYWALDGSRAIQSIVSLLPKQNRDNISEMITEMEAKIGYFIAGQGVLCLMIGGLALIAYLSIGLPNALVLALLAGLLEAVPMIGPILGAIPAGMIALLISPSKLIWVIVATVIIQLLENNFLVPRIMHKAVGVNPFVSLLAIFAFSSLFGIAGALIAIPFAAIIQILLNRLVFHPVEITSEENIGRDKASRLRYELKDLTQDLQKQARLNKGGSALRGKQIDKVMDEIESITTDLDVLLAQVPQEGPHA